MVEFTVTDLFATVQVHEDEHEDGPLANTCPSNFTVVVEPAVEILTIITLPANPGAAKPIINTAANRRRHMITTSASL